VLAAHWRVNWTKKEEIIFLEKKSINFKSLVIEPRIKMVGLSVLVMLNGWFHKKESDVKMKTAKKLIWFYLMALSACGPSSFDRNKDYKKSDFKGEKFGIVRVPKENIFNELQKPFRESFKIGDASDYSKCLADTFNFYFQKSFRDSSDLENTIQIDYNISDTGGTLFNEIVDKGKYVERTINFKIPTKENLFINSPYCRFVLFPKNVYFGIKSSNGGVTLGMSGSPSNPMTSVFQSDDKSLALIFEFVIWDYEKNTFVTSGLARGSASAYYSIVRSDWTDIIEQASTMILSGSHIRKNRY
jgi:hypothetical protein